MRGSSVPLGILLALVGVACHREFEIVPLAERTIYVTDKFYDVQALTKDRAIVVGYGGKIIETKDGGRNWTVLPSGTGLALYGVKFPDSEHGWVVGQEGVALRTDDSGKTWKAQESNAEIEEPDGSKKRAYLFALDALDAQRAWAVGDRSMITRTSDGGKTWIAKKMKMELDLTGGEQLAAADPILYGIKLIDADRAWAVGEFGKILRTEDGGETWKEQEKTLMGKTYFDLLDLPTFFGINVKNPNEAVVTGLDGHIARTADAGKTWAFDEVDAGDVPLVDPLYDVTEDQNGNAWAVGAAGEVVRRAAGDTKWVRAKIGQDVLTWLRSVAFSDPQNGWMVGGFGLIFRTTDGGKTWLPSQG